MTKSARKLLGLGFLLILLVAAILFGLRQLIGRRQDLPLEVPLPVLIDRSDDYDFFFRSDLDESQVF